MFHKKQDILVSQEGINLGCAVMWNRDQNTGADSIGHRGHAPPLLQMVGHVVHREW